MLGMIKKAIPRLPSSRRFRRLVFAQVISGLGDGFTLVAIPFAVLQMASSTASLSLVLTARLVPQAVAMLLGGVVGDRVSPGRILVLSHATRAAVQAAMAVVILSGIGGLGAISALYAVHGVATAFHYPASRAVVPRLVGKDELQTANGVNSMAASLATTLGPMLGGVFVAFANAGAAIAFDALTFVAAAVAVLSLTGIGAVSAPTSSMYEDFFAGLREIRSRRWLASGMAYASFFQFCVLSAVTLLGPAVALKHYDGSWSWGVLLAADGIGSLVGGFVAVRVRFRRIVHAGYVAVLPGAALALGCLAGAPAFWITVAAFVLYGFSLTSFDTLWHVALQSYIPAGSLAKIIAFDGVISLALRPFGLAVMGPLAAVLGEGHILFLCMCLIIAATLPMLASTHIRRMEAPVPARQQEDAAPA